ncbi:hypothetical protein BKA61DRAFT_623081 [Leptodontidium sp. MPI-SDFR-AT-0119]|nr:hypothetical protein BKA61DRAFT_623081 [Leptodontidium sp. MPI-SDFR-AT-0119]
MRLVTQIFSFILFIIMPGSSVGGSEPEAPKIEVVEAPLLSSSIAPAKLPQVSVGTFEEEHSKPEEQGEKEVPETPANGGTQPRDHITLDEAMELSGRSRPPWLGRRKARQARAISNDHQHAVDKRWYAQLHADKTCYGLSAEISAFRPKLENGDFSLLQTLVSNDDSGHPLQTIEAGWIRWGFESVDKQPVDSDSCYFFVFYTTKDYVGDSEDNKQGYAPKVQGYVQKDPTMVPNTTKFEHSHIDGVQYRMTFTWMLVKGRADPKEDGWWLKVNDTWNGYFPLSLFQVPGATSTLADYGTHMEVYGEIMDLDFDRSRPDPNQIRTSTDMGSGKFSAAGWSRAAFIRNIIWAQTPHWKTNRWVHALKSDWEVGTGRAIDPSMYDINWQGWQKGPAGSGCYIGGPGRGLPPGKWSDWDSISPKNMFDAFATITVVQRTPSIWTDILVVDVNGQVRHSYWVDEDYSSFDRAAGWIPIRSGQDTTPKFDKNTRIAAVSRKPTQLDIFGVAEDGKLWTARWVDGIGWSSWRDISNGMTFSFGGINKVMSVAAIARFSSTLDVFVNNNGTMYTTFWVEGKKDWSSMMPAGWQILSGNAPIFPFEAEIFAQATSPISMAVFIVGPNGHVWTADSLVIDPDPEIHLNLWNDWLDIGSPPPSDPNDPTTQQRFHPASQLAVVSREIARLDVFAVAENHILYTANFTIKNRWSSVGQDKYWDAIGTGPFTAGSPPFDASHSDVVALVRQSPSNRTTIDVLIGVAIDADRVYRVFWSEQTGVWSSDTSHGGQGWDTQVGGDRSGRIGVSGMKIAAISRRGSKITVLAMRGDGRADFSDFDETDTPA